MRVHGSRRGAPQERRGEGAVLRPLGHSEHFAWITDHVSPFNFQMHARVTGAVTADALAAALAAVQAAHPLLRAAIDGGPRGRRPVFRTCPAPVPLTERHCAERDVTAEMERDLNTPFDVARGPLVRCVLLRHAPASATLLLTFHHAIADARAATSVLLQLEEALRADRPPRAWGAVPPPAVEARIPKRWRGVRSALAFARDTFALAAALRRWGPLPVPGGAPSPAGARRFHMVRRSLEGGAVEALVAAARRQRVTVHGVLLAAVAAELAHGLPHGRRHGYALTASPVDLRPDGRDDESPGIVFLQGMATVGTRVERDTPFWPLARTLKGSLEGSIARGAHLVLGQAFARQLLALVRPLPSLERRAARVAAVSHGVWRRAPAVAVSNIGVVHASAAPDRTTIVMTSFAATASVVADVASFVVTADGVLTWTFVAAEPAYGREQTAAFADGVLSRLRREITYSSGAERE